jgi:hypothetical protein
MSPLQRTQIRGFIRQRFSDQEGARFERLHDVIDSNPSLRELAGSPIFLSLMIALSEKQRRGTLPRTRLALYERCVDLLMKDWDDLRDLKRPSTVTPRVKLQVLKGLGLELQSRHSTLITRKRLTALVEDMFPYEHYRLSLQEITDELTAVHGLLVSAEGPGTVDAYSFQHITFQSYFAALQLEDAGWQEVLEEVDDSWWREVIVLLAALDHTDAIVNRIMVEAGKEREKNQRRSLILLAADCASNGSASESTLSGLVGCLEEWLAGDDSKTAFEAGAALARVGGSKVIDILKQYLGSPACLHTRAAAAAALCNLTDPSEKVLDILLDALRKGDMETRARAARALGDKGFAWAVDSLLSALSSPKLHEIRPEMLRALNSIIRAPRLDTSSLALVFAILRPMSDDPDPAVADLAQEILDKLRRSEMR